MAPASPLLKVMGSPQFYPHRPAAVQMTQTHISTVFLAGDRVYKVKKPVDFGFLDYSTLRRRAYWCRREVELNRRLAPDLYLGVSKIFHSKKGFSLMPEGRVAEHAVVMKRLPEKRLFSFLMKEGRATVAQVRRIARRVAAFHAEAEPAAARNSRLAVLRRNLEENFRQTEPYIGRTVSRGDYETVAGYSRFFLDERRSLLRKRIGDGRFRDCHGDLHAGHICLVDGIVIFDCLEFNPRLRQCDVAAEIAFLYMDLLYHRHPHLARAFAEEYIARSGDWELRILLPFYACYRAVVREKVESLRFADPQVPAGQKRDARRRAAKYLHLARDFALRDGRPRLFAVGGLPGTGKTTVAGLWAERIGAVCISSDAVRKELAGAGKGRASGAYRSGIYTAEWTRRTYGEVCRRAESIMKDGTDVVIDATFSARAHRRMAAAAARRAGARYFTVECRAPEKLIRRRLVRRGSASLSDADWAVYRVMKREYARPRRKTVRVDTGGDLESALARIAAASFPL